MKDYKISCLSDTDMRQYRFDRSSGLPRGYFDRKPWYHVSDDAIVVWAVLAAFLIVICWGV